MSSAAAPHDARLLLRRIALVSVLSLKLILPGRTRTPPAGPCVDPDKPR